jgi:hypothetical protein
LAEAALIAWVASAEAHAFARPVDMRKHDEGDEIVSAVEASRVLDHWLVSAIGLMSSTTPTAAPPEAPALGGDGQADRRRDEAAGPREF